MDFAKPDSSVEVEMLTEVGDYKAGKKYGMDGSLAHHYVEVLGVARVTKGSVPKAADKAPSPGSPEDRAMQAPPRGKR